MFGKEKSREDEAPVVTKSSSKDIKTLIGEGCKVDGNFYINTYTRIDGTIRGDLTGDSGIVIGIKGKIEGNVVATEVVNYGEIKGNVEAQRLELKKGSVLSGDISVSQLLAELGSTLNGKCSMVEIVRSENTPPEAVESAP
jgi:cytoskeletal protein CcmA (bactofilin family)